MTAEALIATLETRGVVLTVVGDRLSLDAPKGVLTPDVVAELRERKPEVLDILTRPTLRRYLTYLEACRDEASPNGRFLLPPPPPTGLSRTDRSKAYAAWWAAIEGQRRSGIVGSSRYNTPQERN
ncbi:MAG: hypothetical protein HZB26_15635 [Candidatus Hydrogenedentes bacterium]|nr:hypothetical protein [Candidatus Hydrogenedentota bacterium]